MNAALPLTRALAQLDDPAFLGVLFRSLLLTLGAFAAVAVLIAWALESVIGAQDVGGDLSWLLGGVGGSVLTGALAFYLFLPITAVVASLFVDSVATAVERRWYPELPPAAPAPLSAQVWDGVALGLRVLAWQALALILSFFSAGLAAVIGWAVAAWAVGRGLFVAAAMRRMSRSAASELFARERGRVMLQGALVAAGSLLPVLNLAVPVLATAAMVHVLHTGSVRNGRRGSIPAS